MRGLSIKWQIGVVAALATLGMLLSAVLQQYSSNQLESLGNARVFISDIRADMLMLRRNEKDFLARKSLKYIDKFKTNYETAQGSVTGLSQILEENDLDPAITGKLTTVLSDYQNKFLALVDLQKKIGLDHKSGLYGALRNAVHQAEEMINTRQENKLSKDMLMLRRREKDFMLRLDLKYLKKFNKDLVVLQQDISDASLGEKIKLDISTAMKSYETDFKALVNANVKLGLSSKEGLLGEMRKTIHQSEELLAQLQADTGQHIETEMTQSNIQSAIISAVLIIAILGHRFPFGSERILVRIVRHAVRS